MSAGDGRVHRHRPLQLRDSVGLALQLGQDPIPRAVLGPQVEPPPNRLPRRKLSRNVPPRRTRPEPPTDRLQHQTVITPPPPSTRCPIRQERLNPRPHRIRKDLHTIHRPRLPPPTAKIGQTRPSRGPFLYDVATWSGHIQRYGDATAAACFLGAYRSISPIEDAEFDCLDLCNVLWRSLLAGGN